MSDSVKQQYEAYPYPERDPRDEARRLLVGSPGNLAEINHYIFTGRRDFSAPFRALVAGGGTGDATIMLAQQLADAGSKGEVVYLDLSAASQKIARARARARGLANITFIQGSLLDLPEMVEKGDLAPFDYIDCCGVLHHLPDPDEGLRALAAVLKDDGGMGLMVYGELGRTGVYHMQDMLAGLTADDDPRAKVDMAKRLLAALPKTNWFQRNPFHIDHTEGGDAGIYDLLLHSQDRPYRVPEVRGFLESAAMRLVSFIEPAIYEPKTYLSDPKIMARLADMDDWERWAFAELLIGHMSTHVFYAVKAANGADTLAAPEEDAVPLMLDGKTEAFARSLTPGGWFVFEQPRVTQPKFPIPRLGPAIIGRIDETRTIREIHEEINAAQGGNLTWDAFKADFDKVYDVFGGLNMMHLRF